MRHPLPRLILSALLSLCTLSCNGCMAIGARTLGCPVIKGPKMMHFAGMRASYDVLTQERQNHSPATLTFVVFDMPFSLIGDVLFLPFDTYDHFHTSKYPYPRELRDFPSK